MTKPVEFVEILERVRAAPIVPMRDTPAPIRRHVIIAREFDLAVHNILDYAETRLLEGESLDLDHVADLIASRIRPNLHVVYGPGAPEGGL
ncbi:MAG: hypothetical protein ABI639_14450 [Thermoanaerobaculia bacterium]